MGLGQWLHDTAREVVSGGKAQTKTYNTPARKSGPIVLPGQAAPSQYVSKPQPSQKAAKPAPAILRPQQQSWGEARPRPLVASTPSWATQKALAATKAANAEKAAADARAEAARTAARETAAKAATAKRTADYEAMPDWQKRMQLERPKNAPLVPDVLTEEKTKAKAAQAAAHPRALTEFEQEQNRLQARANDPNFGLKANTHELTDQEFQALTPRQRAAVLFNTGLVRARKSDKDNDGSEVKDYLSSVGLNERITEPVEFRRYTDLSAAIDDALLKRIDTPVPEEKVVNGVTIRQEPNQDQIDANTVASAIADKLRTEGRIPGLKTKLAGFGTTANDQLLRDAYDLVVDSSIKQTPEDVAQGLAAANQRLGTNVTTDQLWAFVKAQIEAADFGSIAGTDVSVPVSNENITPLSVKDIRARYGL